MIKIRAGWGSYSIVERIFAFDENNQIALVLFDNKTLDRVSTTELQAIDDNGKYYNVEEHVKEKAEYILE